MFINGFDPSFLEINTPRMTLNISYDELERMVAEFSPPVRDDYIPMSSLSDLHTHRQFTKVYGRDDSRKLTLQKYVFFLAVTDFLVLIQIPIFFPYLYYGEWLYGLTTCKLFWFADVVNKTLSIHILAGMALERYLIVKSSVYGKQRRIVSLVLLLPIVQFAEIQVTVVGENTKFHNCVVPMPEVVNTVYRWYLFFVSFLVPGLIVLFSYISLLAMLRQRYRLTHMQENSKTQLVQKVSKSIFYITAFHFLSSTPFWLTHILPGFSDLLEDDYPNGYFRYKMFVLLMPYLNSATNWCFYAMLTQRLRKQIFRRSSSNYTTIKHGRPASDSARPTTRPIYKYIMQFS
ncbi:unnamed protein product, partial [Mesorhabditis spiculigera]